LTFFVFRCQLPPGAPPGIKSSIDSGVTAILYGELPHVKVTGDKGRREEGLGRDGDWRREEGKGWR
jgi:hypothetical protein